MKAMCTGVRLEKSQAILEQAEELDIRKLYKK
jgi:hypothetical protein